jgi:streptogramin lyase
MANQNIIKVDAATGELTILPTPTKNSGPRRGQFDDQDRLWFAEFKADKIGMLDTRTGTFKEFPLPTKWTGPYDVALDKNSEAWTGGMFSDRLVRLDTKTGKAVEYQMPRNQHAPDVHRQFDHAGNAVGGQQPRRFDCESGAAGLAAVNTTLSLPRVYRGEVR